MREQLPLISLLVIGIIAFVGSVVLILTGKTWARIDSYLSRIEILQEKKCNTLTRQARQL